MKAYIKSCSCISPQPTFTADLCENYILQHEKKYMQCIEPDYKEYINPMLIRRMSRIVKMGVTAAIKCLKDASVEEPDAIITGTGLGCIEDTEKFLNEIIKNKEQFLPPTSFIQSTHNTIAGQIALLLECNSYNFTYVHRNLSFENALLDAILMLQENENQQILLGGVDEITDTSYTILRRLGVYRDLTSDTATSIHNPADGSIAGEGAVFFLLSQQKDNAIAQILDVKTFHHSENFIEKNINDILTENGMNILDIDTVFLGLSGDQRYDYVYQNLADGLFQDKNILFYKHLCGEYFTSVAFAVWSAANILKKSQIPEIYFFRKTNVAPKNILIVNHFLKQSFSLILITK